MLFAISNSLATGTIHAAQRSKNPSGGTAKEWHAPASVLTWAKRLPRSKGTDWWSTPGDMTASQNRIDWSYGGAGLDLN